MKEKMKWMSYIIIGLLLLCGAAGLTIHNIREDQESGEASDKVMEVLSDRILDQSEDAGVMLNGGTDRVHNTEEIDGHDYIGVLTVPSLELQLPVMDEWDYDRLKISPCRLSGTAYGDDLVIVAHNYSRHFGRLNTLNSGDSVSFTDVDGATIEYAVVVKEQVSPHAVEDVTSGEWDLTLVTCTIGGQSRVVIRCDRK